MIIVNRPQNYSQHIPRGTNRLESCWPLSVVGSDERMCSTRVAGSSPQARDISTRLERAGRLRYPLPGGPDSGMPQVGCGRFRRRLCAAEIIRGQPSSRRHSQTSVQNTADQARHARFIDIRSDAFGFGVAARAEIGLIRLRQDYGGRRLGYPK